MKKITLKYRYIFTVQKLFFLFLAQLLIQKNAFSIDQHTVIEGKLLCSVTGSLVVLSENGVFKQSKGFDGGIKVKDKISLKYNFSEYEARIVAESIQDKKIIWMDFFSIKNGETKLKRARSGGTVFDRGIHAFALSKESIRGESVFGLLRLHRYYKNEWHGILLTEGSPEGMWSHTVTLNCVHQTDKIDEVLQLINN